MFSACCKKEGFLAPASNWKQDVPVTRNSDAEFIGVMLWLALHNGSGKGLALDLSIQ